MLFRSSTVSVKVTLQDINDNAPTSDKQFYTVMVSEATNVNTSILAVKVNEKKYEYNKLCYRFPYYVVTFQLLPARIHQAMSSTG